MLAQSSKAESPIERSESGSGEGRSFVHPLKADSSIAVSEFGNTREV